MLLSFYISIIVIVYGKKGILIMKSRLIIGAFLAFLTIVLAACSSHATTSAGTHAATAPTSTSPVVHVSLLKNTIQSSRVTFVAGQNYTFSVTNKRSTPSNFIIDTRPQGPSLSGTQPKVLYLINSLQLPPGKTKVFSYTFPITAPQSAVQFAEELPGPNGAGVRIPVQVTK